MNTTIITSHNYNNEYLLPNWEDKVTFINSDEGEDENGNETYLNKYKVNLTGEEAEQYINHILLPYIDDIMNSRGADDDCFDYIPSLITEAIQFIQLLQIDPTDSILTIITYGDNQDYYLGAGSEYLDLTGYLK